MIRPLFWAAAALKDLDRSIAYIAERNPLAARGVLEEIEQAVGRLELTATGRLGRVAGTYEKVVAGRPFGVAYALRNLPEGGEGLVILRVTHAARGWPKGEWRSGPAGYAP